jgi:hypothetical protein
MKTELKNCTTPVCRPYNSGRYLDGPSQLRYIDRTTKGENMDNYANLNHTTKEIGSGLN